VIYAADPGNRAPALPRPAAALQKVRHFYHKLDDEAAGDMEADWQAGVEDFPAEDEYACIDQPAEGKPDDAGVEEQVADGAGPPGEAGGLGSEDECSPMIGVLPEEDRADGHE
jgi:hypothetical protein